MTQHNTEIAAPVVKAGSALAAAGFAGLTVHEWASILACIYTSMLAGEWLYKKVWLRFVARRRADSGDDDEQYPA